MKKIVWDLEAGDVIDEGTVTAAHRYSDFVTILFVAADGKTQRIHRQRDLFVTVY